MCFLTIVPNEYLCVTSEAVALACFGSSVLMKNVSFQVISLPSLISSGALVNPYCSADIISFLYTSLFPSFLIMIFFIVMQKRLLATNQPNFSDSYLTQTGVLIQL